MGIFCDYFVVAGIAYFECGVYVGVGAAVFAAGSAEGAAAVCGGGTDGVDELLDAIGDLHAVFLPLHDGIVRTNWAGAGIGADGGFVCGAGGDQ